jgi:hypothetical protein
LNRAPGSGEFRLCTPEESRDTGVEAVRKQHEAELMAIAGVTGVAIGRTTTGDDAIIVYVTDASVSKLLPKEISGYAVQAVVTGPINALPK